MKIIMPVVAQYEDNRPEYKLSNKRKQLRNWNIVEDKIHSPVRGTDLPMKFKYHDIYL